MNRQGGRTYLRLTGMIVLLIGIIAAAVPGSSETSAQTEPQSDTTLRVVHASPDSPDLDVVVDGQVRYRRLKYGHATPYGSIVPGDHTFQLTPAGLGSDQAVFETTATVEAGQSYIAVASGSAAQLTIINAPVTLDSIDIGKSRIRAINASPDAGTIDVVANGNSLIDNVDANTASNYTDIDLGSYSIEVTPDGSDQTLLSLPNLALVGGLDYDIVVFGSASADGLQSLILTTTVSPPCGLMLGGGAADACITVVNTIGLAWSIDLYYNNVRVLDSVGQGNRVAYTSVPAVPGADAYISIVPAGMSAELAYTYTYAELEPGQAYELLLLGTAEDPTMIIGRVDLTPLPTGQARLRLVHGVSGGPTVNLVVSGGSALFSNVSYQDVTDYIVVDAGDYALQVQDADSGSVLRETNATIRAGLTYDVIAFNTPGEAAAAEVATAVATVEGSPAAGLETLTGGNAQVTTLVLESTTFPRGGSIAPAPGAADGTPEAESTPES